MLTSQDDTHTFIPTQPAANSAALQGLYRLHAFHVDPFQVHKAMDLRQQQTLPLAAASSFVVPQLSEK